MFQQSECSCCGKNIVFTYSLEIWVYKVTTGSKTKYQCSYSCFRKEYEKKQARLHDSKMKRLNKCVV